MRLSLPARLRVLLMLVAFGIGLAGQAVAAMSMPLAMPQDGSQGVTVSMVDMQDCPGCADTDSSGNSAKGLMPSCAAAALCSISVTPAIPPQVSLAFPPRERIHFAIARGDTVRGLSIPPDLGPPRQIHHS